MTAVQADEIIPGLVVHLDPAIIRRHSGCRVNNPPGQEVKGPHFFLILEVDVPRSLCLALTLFSGAGSGRRVNLDENQKDGLGAKWKGVSTYYFKWQVWEITFAAVSAASVADNSVPLNRRSYLAGQPDDLKAILAEFESFGGAWTALVSS